METEIYPKPYFKTLIPIEMDFTPNYHLTLFLMGFLAWVDADISLMDQIPHDPCPKVSLNLLLMRASNTKIGHDKL